MRAGKGIIQGLGLLLATFCSSLTVQAADPPAGTITDLDNVGLFDGSTDSLTSCVALQDPNGAALLDANGQPRRYAVTLSLTRATLIFKVTGTAAWNSSRSCSGVYRNGVYTDAVLITNLASTYNGRVWNLTLDVLNASLEFKLRLDSSFSAVRTFGANTTALASDLGDFQSSATREYFTANLPALITFKLPQCSDPQGDETRVVVVKDGVVVSTSGVPGGNYGWNTSGAATGEHRFQAYCSDEVGIRQLAAAKGLAFANSYIAVSATAPGTLTLRISQG